MLVTRTPASRTALRPASHPTVSSFGEMIPTRSTPSSDQSARSSWSEWRIAEMLVKRARGWTGMLGDSRGELVPGARGELRREELLHAAELHRDHPLVMAAAPALWRPHEAGGLDGEALVEFPGPRTHSVVHRTNADVDPGRVAVDDWRHAGDVVVRHDLVASDHVLHGADDVGTAAHQHARCPARRRVFGEDLVHALPILRVHQREVSEHDVRNRQPVGDRPRQILGGAHAGRPPFAFPPRSSIVIAAFGHMRAARRRLSRRASSGASWRTLTTSSSHVSAKTSGQASTHTPCASHRSGSTMTFMRV